jgi:Fic family protein
MAAKNWNWLHQKRAQFTYDKEVLEYLELKFSKNTGLVLGAIKHIEGISKNNLLAERLGEEALKTSEIESEILNRESVQSSIKKNLGFANESRKISPVESSISEMMVDLYHHFNTL